MNQVPVLKELVLLGGGHSHVEVMRMFGMDPVPGVRVTLVTKDVHTAYSGMLPGYVAGYYSFDECHLDLARLAILCNVRFIKASASGIDSEAQEICLEGRPFVRYDVLSIDTGITPSGQGIPGSMQFTTAVKPVSTFVGRLEKIKLRHQLPDRPLKVIVVGGGAGGVELAMSMYHSLTKPTLTTATSKAEVRLLSRGKILQSHPAAARTKFLRIAKERGVVIEEGCAVVRVEEKNLFTEDGREYEFDECLWCTQAGAPEWLHQTGLPLDEKGFLAISNTLQSEGGPENVFACGDVASCAASPRPKAGVFAVRQGMPLAANLRSYLKGEALVPFTPQTTFLGLITTGDKYAVATKGWFCLEGAYLWTWKDKIDRAWMDKYGKDLPVMSPEPLSSEAATTKESAAVLASAHMRCTGCGSKVGATTLSRALSRLRQDVGGGDIILGLDSPDDAAVIRPPTPGHVLIQTVDFFKAIISDPFEFGMIAANHALGDCHAMHGQAQTALAIVVVPYATEQIVEDTLCLMMAGAVQALNAAGCTLVGGHSTEGSDLSLGFAINGVAKEAELLKKSGAKPGQAVILTKPLGTGVVLAASMQGKCKGRWLYGAMELMKQSNAAAADVVWLHGASSCTDVTGFGLLGHLQELAFASQVKVEVHINSVPILEGALSCSGEGVSSSLLPQNSRVAAWCSNVDTAAEHKKWPLLFDPQTGGGLLATMPQAQAESAVEDLHQLGYVDAAIVGSVASKADHLHRDRPESILDLKLQQR